MKRMGAHFSEATLKFLRGLARHNDRDWFNARKDVYEAELKAPMLAVVGEVNEAMLKFAPHFVRDPAKCVMRIYRDIRFSKNKQPYKTHMAAWWARQGMEKTSGGGFYLQVGTDGLLVAAGCYMPEREQLLAIRRHLQTTHVEMRKILASKKLAAAGFTPLEPLAMTRPPKGFQKDDPAIDLIQQRQWGLSASLPVELALQPELVAEIARLFRLSSPLVELLNESLPGAPKPIFQAPKEGKTQ
jgi:uncharacterized protein (TIGR02453 family)